MCLGGAQLLDDVVVSYLGRCDPETIPVYAGKDIADEFGLEV